MRRDCRMRSAALTLALALGACATKTALVVDTGTTAPATTVQRRGQTERLTGTPIAVGMPLPATTLLEAGTLATVDLARERGKVLFLSVILSVDTAV